MSRTETPAVNSALILAAGEGKRLRPLTRHRPKPMLPAGTDPILKHVFDELIAAGIDEFTVVIGYGRTSVQSHFGSSYRERPIEYVVQETQLGSGHALSAAASTIDETTLVVNGDQLVDRSIIAETIDVHGEGTATIGVVPSADVSEYGGVLTTSEGTVERVIEKPTDDRNYRLNAGVYVLEPAAVEIMAAVEPTSGELSIVDCLAGLLESGERIAVAETDGMWIDATYPWDLLEVADTLLETGRLETQISSSAQVHASATIVGPVVVASDCVIGPGAVVGPNVCLRENVTVGANATVERSVIDSDTQIGSNATVIDCVAGRGVQIGAGSTVVGGPGDVHVGTTIHQGEQLGALIADRSRDNGGVTYAPGTIVGAEVVIHAGATVRGSIDSETEVC